VLDIQAITTAQGLQHVLMCGALHCPSYTSGPFSAGIPSRSRRRNGMSSQYSRSVASCSPTKRPQSAAVSNGANALRTGSPAAPSSPDKPSEAFPTNATKHRRARSWVPHWNSKKEAAAGAFVDHEVVELVTDESDLPDVLPDVDKSGKSKKVWGWGWSRHKDASTATLATDDDEEARDQACAVAEGSPVNAAISQDTKARPRLQCLMLLAFACTTKAPQHRA
jgi:hypothetical protein